MYKSKCLCKLYTDSECRLPEARARNNLVCVGGEGEPEPSLVGALTAENETDELGKKTISRVSRPTKGGQFE